MTDREKQDLLDDEHLKLLRIGYIVGGAADAFFALFPLIYVVIGIFIAAAGPPGRPGEPNPALFGLFFVLIGLFVSFLFALQAGLKFLTARAIGRRQSRMLCLVAAGLACMQMPWGTLLGVFTFMVLGRASVKDRFEGASSPSMLSAPPARAASSLFDQEEIRRE
jgi:hypothetical protein